MGSKRKSSKDWAQVVISFDRLEKLLKGSGSPKIQAELKRLGDRVGALESQGPSSPGQGTGLPPRCTY